VGCIPPWWEVFIPEWDGVAFFKKFLEKTPRQNNLILILTRRKK